MDESSSTVTAFIDISREPVTRIRDERRLSRNELATIIQRDLPVTRLKILTRYLRDRLSGDTLVLIRYRLQDD